MRGQNSSRLIALRTTPGLDVRRARQLANWRGEDERGKMDQFIANPDAVVRDNKMKPYGGLASADTRAKVIAYLESVTTAQ